MHWSEKFYVSLSLDFCTVPEWTILVFVFKFPKVQHSCFLQKPAKDSIPARRFAKEVIQYNCCGKSRPFAKKKFGLVIYYKLVVLLFCSNYLSVLFTRFFQRCQWLVNIIVYIHLETRETRDKRVYSPWDKSCATSFRRHRGRTCRWSWGIATWTEVQLARNICFTKIQIHISILQNTKLFESNFPTWWHQYFISQVFLILLRKIMIL